VKLHRKAPLDGGLEATEFELRVRLVAFATRRRDGPARDRVPKMEHVVSAPSAQVRLPQEAPRVEAYQHRQVGLLTHVGEIDPAALPDVARRREGERGVGAAPKRQPLVRVDGGGAVLRIDDHDLRALVAGLDQIVGVGHLGHRRVHHPYDEEIGEEPLVRAASHMRKPERERGTHVQVADLGPVVGERGPHHVEEAGAPGRRGALVEVRPQVVDNGVAPVCFGDVDQLLGDLPQRLTPADALPTTRAPLTHAFERNAEPTGPVHHIRVAGALLAAPGIEVGQPGLGRLVVRGLLLAHHDAVPDIEIPVAGAAAVEPAVASLRHAVPRPAPPVEILPAAEPGRLWAQLRGASLRRAGLFAKVEQGDSARQARRGHSRELEEVASAQAGIASAGICHIVSSASKPPARKAPDETGRL